MFSALRNSYAFKVQITLSLLVLCLSISIISVWQHKTKKILADTVKDVYSHVSDAIISKLDTFISEGNNIMLNQQLSGGMHIEITDDPDALADYLKWNIMFHKNISHFYFASSSGQFTLAGRADNGDFFSIQQSDYPNQYTKYQQGIYTPLNKKYDPRTRDWFKQAITSTKPVWTGTYMYPFREKSGVTLSQAVYTDGGDLVGVYGLDLNISAINNNLANAILSANGDSFIFAQNGSTITNIHNAVPNHFDLQPSLHSQSNISNKIWQSFDQKEMKAGTTTLTVQNEEWLVYYRPYQFNETETWWVVSVAPAADFMPKLWQTSILAQGITITILALTLLIGFFTMKRLLSPIRQITYASSQISQGNLNVYVDTARKDEFGLLARTFNKMTTQLKRTIKQLQTEKKETVRLNALLEQSNQQLEQKIAERTQDLLKANQQLTQLANQDPLTGAANRRFFWQQVNEKQQPGQGWLLLLDIDHFKAVNDQYGHHIGDQTLTQFSHTIMNSLDNNTIFGRIGGEEFAIWYPCRTQKEAENLAHILLKRIENLTLHTDSKTIFSITTSIGIAPCWEHAIKAYRYADKQLYLAKDNGRNCFRCLDENVSMV